MLNKSEPPFLGLKLGAAKKKMFGCAVILIMILGVIVSYRGKFASNTSPVAVIAPAATIIPTPAPTPVPTPAIPIVLNGRWSDVTQRFILPQGLCVFTMSSNAPRNFSTKLLDENGEQKELLADVIGAYSGSRAVQIEKPDLYILEVESNAKWTINVVPIAPPEFAPAIRTFQGAGPMATALFSLDSGLVQFQMKHAGRRNFSVRLLDSDSDYINVLANEIGRCDISKAIEIKNAGIYIMDVDASAPWSITIQ